MIFDIETDGLLDSITKIHVISSFSPEQNEYNRVDPMQGSFENALEELMNAPYLCGHNIISFDIPAIQKLYPWFEPKGEIIDTLVWARLVYPNIKDKDYARHQLGRLPGKLIGSHSLEAYGYRLGVFKGDFGKTTDWQRWTPEMSEYCDQDVVVTTQLYDRLLTTDYDKDSLQLEHDVATIIARQERYGVLFDDEAGQELEMKLRVKLNELGSVLQGKFLPFYKRKGKVFTPKADNKRFHYVKGAPMSKVELTDFNPGSNQHIAQALQRVYKWEPTVYTDKSGDPQISEEILKELPYPEAKLLAEYQMVQKRLAMLSEGKQAWFKNIKPDGRIHGGVNTCGAVTGRMTHHHPNLAQVPAGYSPYGKECRGLFTVPEGYKLVGCDADGLEARCLGHYMARYDEGVYAKAVVEGKKSEGTDVHTLNMKALGIDSRDTAKTWFYAFIYGAGDEKLGNILGKDQSAGKKSRAKFLKAIPALANLTEAVKSKVKTHGYLKGLDGRMLSVRAQHSALNTLLQSAGAIIMKKALVICKETLEAKGYYGKGFEFVLNVHDEFQAEVHESIADECGEIMKQSIIKAGEFYKFRCPLDGSYDVGDNWAETH